MRLSLKKKASQPHCLIGKEKYPTSMCINRNVWIVILYSTNAKHGYD